MRSLSPTVERTAKQLAQLEFCSIPTVYRRLRALKAAGVEISESKAPGRKTGPAPVWYRLVIPAGKAMRLEKVRRKRSQG